jgi:hypothetical protein
MRLREDSGLIDIGKLHVVVEKELPLGEAAAVHELSETGHVRERSF